MVCDTDHMSRVTDRIVGVTDMLHDVSLSFLAVHPVFTTIARTKSKLCVFYLRIVNVQVNYKCHI